MIRCASKLIAPFKHSAPACGALKDRQQQMNINEKKLVQSSSTRWNSTFYMLERLIKMRWPVIAVLSDESVTKRRDRYLGLTKEQWMLAEELLKILKPFEVATTVLCGEEHATISCTLPILYGLIKHLEPQEEFVSCLATFRRVVLNEIKQRWELDNLDVSSCMVLASVLDPRQTFHHVFNILVSCIYMYCCKFAMYLLVLRKSFHVYKPIFQQMYNNMKNQ